MTKDKSFTQAELDYALYDVEDMLQRMLIPFFLLKTTAACIYHDEPLSGKGVYVGVFNREINDYRHRLLNELIAKAEEGAEINDKGFSYKAEGVPVQVTFVHGDYDFFGNFTERSYLNQSVEGIVKAEGSGRLTDLSYKIPNPFEVYYKQRHVIE